MHLETLFPRTSSFFQRGETHVEHVIPTHVVHEAQARENKEIPEGPSPSELEEWYRMLNEMLLAPHESSLHNPMWDELQEIRDGIYRYLR